MCTKQVTKEIERLMKEIANNINKLELTRLLEIERTRDNIDLADISEEVLRLTKQTWHEFFLRFWGEGDWAYGRLGARDEWIYVLSKVSGIKESTLHNFGEEIWKTNFKFLSTEKGFSEFLGEDMTLGYGLDATTKSVGYWFKEFYPESDLTSILKDVDTTHANFKLNFDEKFVEAYMIARHKIDWGPSGGSVRFSRRNKEKLKENFRRDFVVSLQNFLLNLPFKEISEFYEEE